MNIVDCKTLHNLLLRDEPPSPVIARDTSHKLYTDSVPPDPVGGGDQDGGKSGNHSAHNDNYRRLFD